MLDEIAALPEKSSGVVDEMVVAIYGAGPGDWVRSGALYGGSTSDRASEPRFWLPLRQDREPYALFYARNVPEQLVKWTEDQGTRDQHFSDGYVALDAIRQYLDRSPFYESPEEWAAERDEEDDALLN